MWSQVGLKSSTQHDLYTISGDKTSTRKLNRRQAVHIEEEEGR